VAVLYDTVGIATQPTTAPMHAAVQIRPLIPQGVARTTGGHAPCMGDWKRGPAVPWVMMDEGQPEATS
jgi:hypothetical protein